MRKERILSYGESWETAGLASVIDAHGQSARHRIVGTAASIEEVDGIAEKGILPTVAVLGPNARQANGQEIADHIRWLFPKIKIIALNDEHMDWADETLNAPGGKELVNFLTNLKH